MLLGIEIGGTKLQLALAERGALEGELLRVERLPIDPDAGASGILALIQSALPKSGVEAIGVGFGGPIEAGRVLASHQVNGWAGFPLAEWFTAKLGVPCAVANDADVAGLAESRYGAGRGHDPCFYVTAGSGVGGGLIVNGEIYTGAGRGASEIGHCIVTVRGEVGSVESFASGWAIARRAGVKTGQDARNLAEIGDAHALRAINDAVEALAQGLATVVALVCPRRVVFGGGVSLMPVNLVLEPLRKRLVELTFAPFAGLTDLVAAELAERAVPVGAVELARRL